MANSLLSVLALATLATADAPPARLGLEALLARPVSPGVVALLLPYVGDERASGRVTEALVHPDATVRAAAARVAGVAALLPAGLTILRALEAETDRSAAAEQLSAGVFLLSPGDDLALVPAARKHGLVDLLAETLANVRGPAAVPLLDPLREAGLTEGGEAAFIVSATRRGRERLNIVAASALRTPPSIRMWSAVLSLARQPRAEMAPGMLLAALGSQNPEIRAAVYWHLALTVAKGTPLSLEIEAAISRTAEAASPESANVDAAFALVVLRRAQQGPEFGGDWGARVAAGTAMIPLDPQGQPERIARFLTKAEARALSHRFTRGTSDKILEREAAAKPDAENAGAYGGLLFAGGLPPGTLRDILAVTGCKPAADLRVAALVEYRPDGRPRQVAFTNDPLSPACAEAARPALGLILAPPGLVNAADPDRRTLVIVPLNKEALECADQPEPSAPEHAPEGPPAAQGKVKEPRKVKHVAPWYPARARVERRQGVVIVEAVVGTSGCIRAVRVVRSVSPELDASALIAVGQWRYTPTFLGGQPVPVIMTVTVNFDLD